MKDGPVLDVGWWQRFLHLRTIFILILFHFYISKRLSKVAHLSLGQVAVLIELHLTWHNWWCQTFHARYDGQHFRAYLIQSWQFWGGWADEWWMSCQFYFLINVKITVITKHIIVLVFISIHKWWSFISSVVLTVFILNIFLVYTFEQVFISMNILAWIIVF